ncbi:MAG: DsbA family protein [Coriobacteriia bacterium]|nr:DsbA family protein [Coriobacteriia bacterium]
MSDTPDREHDHNDESRESVTPRVLVFFDYACPFCYLDWPRFKRMRSEHAVELFLVPFELRPTLDARGVSMEAFGGGHSERVEEHMQLMAREGDLLLASPGFMPNTHLALSLGEFARDGGPQVHELVHEALFAAYNGHAADIGEMDVLVRIAQECGLSAEEARGALDAGTYDERLHQFRHMALSFGIEATPAALICNELLIGSRPYRVLEESLRHCLVDERTITAQAAP